MKILINLIGEQPIPNLLPILHFKPDKTIVLHTQKTKSVANRLKKIVKNITFVQTEPYNFSNNLKKLKSVYQNNEEYIFNITGGTKIMSVALFQFALETNSKVVYLDSQNNINRLIYIVEKNEVSNKIEYIEDMISVDTYLKAHLNEYYISEHENQNLYGIKYENAIIEILSTNGFEVLQNIKPKGEGNQLEIDAVIKKTGTNNFAVVEIKSGKEEENTKRGIDQLSTAGSREYLGTYTKRILIARLNINESLKKLANKHSIIVIDGILFNHLEQISEVSKQILINKMNEILI